MIVCTYTSNFIHTCVCAGSCFTCQSRTHFSLPRPLPAHPLLCPTLSPNQVKVIYRGPYILLYHRSLITLHFVTWHTYRSVAVGEQLLPLELASGCSEDDQLQPTKSSINTVGLALNQVIHLVAPVECLASSSPGSSQCLNAWSTGKSLGDWDVHFVCFGI